VIRKCTQSGYTEAILNIIRWMAKYSPRNVLYAINSKEEAENIRARLVATFERLGENVLSEDGSKEMGKYTLRLRALTVWFIGSYSGGAFSNKYAPLVIIDEKDDHAELKDNAETGDLAAERLKTDDQNGLLIEVSKPQMKDGPIDAAHATGNQEIYLVPCPHCGTYQEIVWERVKFGHCRDLTGHWDKKAILADTYYECIAPACKGQIRDSHKPWMNPQGRWLATAEGSQAADPETVSQEMTDFYSVYRGSSLGHLAIEFIAATEAASRGDFRKLQGWWNGRAGKGFESRVEKIEEADVHRCRKPYKRGIIPEENCVLILGVDIGLYVNTRWVVLALNRLFQAWLIDYGNGGGPLDALALMRTKSYPCLRTGISQPIKMGFIDARYRTREVYEACLRSGGAMLPTMGMKDGQTIRSVAWAQIPALGPNFGVIQFRDSDAKHDLYIERIKEQREPGLNLPEDTEKSFMLELSQEHLIRDPMTQRPAWGKPRGPNHGGDGVKVALTGWDFITGGKLSQRSQMESSTAPSIPADFAQLDLAAGV
jgi:hypothetical protein